MPRVHGVLDIIPVTPSFPASSDQNTPSAHDVTANSSQLFSLGLIIHPSNIYESRKNLSLHEIVYMAVWASVTMNHPLASECLWGGGCARRVGVVPMAITTSGECQRTRQRVKRKETLGIWTPVYREQSVAAGGGEPPPQHPPCGGDPPLWAERGRIEVHPPPLADCSVPSSRWRTKDQEARPERSSYCHSRARLTAANQRNLKSSLVHIKEKRLNVCMYFPSFPRFYQMPTTNQPTKQEPEPHPDEAMPTASPGPTQIRANSKEMCLANGCPVLCWPR